MAQLSECLLPTAEVYGLNLVIGKFLNRILFTVNCIVKRKVKNKRPRMTHFFKKKMWLIRTSQRLA